MIWQDVAVYLGVKFIFPFQQRMIVLGRSSMGFWTFVAAFNKFGEIFAIYCLQIKWPIAFFYAMYKRYIESVMIIGKQLFCVTDGTQRKFLLVPTYNMDY